MELETAARQTLGGAYTGLQQIWAAVVSCFLKVRTFGSQPTHLLHVCSLQFGTLHNTVRPAVPTYNNTHVYRHASSPFLPSCPHTYLYNMAKAKPPLSYVDL